MTVIAGTDGSERAERAVTAAAALASALMEELVVVCVHREGASEANAPAMNGTLTPSEHAGALANASANRVMAAFPGLEAHGRAYAGKPAEGILRAAADVEASVIVVGNLRVQDGSRVLGSIASDIARKASCDVYIAHTDS